MLIFPQVIVAIQPPCQHTPEAVMNYIGGPIPYTYYTACSKCGARL